MARKSKSLGDEITAELLKPKIKDYDIEDEELVTTHTGDNSSSDDESEDDENLKRSHYVKTQKSKLRSSAINLGSKYEGEVTSRSSLFDDEAEEDSNEEDDDDDDEEEESEEEEKDESAEESDDILADVTDSEQEDEENDDEDGSDQNDDDESEDNSSEDEEESHKRSQLNKILAQEKAQIITRLSNSAKSDALKGYAVTQQYKFFDKILDSRIKFQKAISSSNQLPVDSQAYKQNKSNSTNKKLEEAKSLLFDVLDKVVNIRAKIYNQENIVKQEVKVNPKKRNLDSYLSETNKLDDVLKAFQKNVLVKWSNKVQSASGSTALNSSKFKNFNQNSYVQVQNNLQDMDRLVKRTKINRRKVNPIGYVESEHKLTEDGEELDSEDEEVRKQQARLDQSLQENDYVFDDEDFYRVLLNDMVDKKISDKQSTSSAIVTLTKNTNKVHKNYDRMASKGRKLNYTVQESLQYFEAPKHKAYLWNDDQIDELFASLLGQKVNMMEESDSESGDEPEEKQEIAAIKSSGLKLFG
ncbi:unnamed protein product [Ambrosiozyma monospora]|uniref:Unnamed protein product n=1 Tax=Ambrosiozyma monospora TaxID=43982 RepID=A0ACB5SRN0_AMBMO|nr:unnamed protein product [Ambrosiozyma monospora]